MLYLSDTIYLQYQPLQIKKSHKIQKPLPKYLKVQMEIPPSQSVVRGQKQEACGQTLTKTFLAMDFQIPLSVIGNQKLKSVQIKFLKDTMPILVTTMSTPKVCFKYRRKCLAILK